MNTVHLLVCLDLYVGIYASEVKKSIFGINVFMKSCFYSEKCYLCELVAVLCNILHTIV